MCTQNGASSCIPTFARGSSNTSSGVGGVAEGRTMIGEEQLILIR